MDDQIIETHSESDATLLDVDNDPDFLETGTAARLMESTPDADTGTDGAEDGERADLDAAETTQQPQTAIDEQLAKLAKEYGVDLNNESDFAKLDQKRLLQRLADSQRYIDQLKTGAKPQESQSTEVNWAEGLEDATGQQQSQQQTQESTAKPEAQAQQQAGQQTVDPFFDDIGKDWKTPVDAVQAENEAFSEGDWDKVAQIKEAALKRYVAHMFMPMARQMAEELAEQKISQFRQKELGDVLPRVRQATEKERMADDRQFVLDRLSGDSNLKDVIPALFKVEDGEVEFQGQKYPNTPYNRLLAENADMLLNIRVEDPNPRIAYRKTLDARYRAAARLHQLQNSAPQAAQALVQAGRVAQQREVGQDRIRQSLNAGKGAATHGRQSGGDDYVSDLVSRASSEHGLAAKLWGK